MKVVSDEGVSGASSRRVRDLADAWCDPVAAALGLAVPATITVHVHSALGVSWTMGHTIHLYEGPSGTADVDQLSHELVHTIAGLSPCRFLAEGLAVDIASLLGFGAPCFPCWESKPDMWAAALLRQQRWSPPLIAPIVTGAQAISHNGGIISSAHVENAWRVYVVAGSFTGFLFEHLDRQAFWAGYHRGACWADLDELGSLESSWLAALPEQIGNAERRRMVRSLDLSHRQAHWLSELGK